MSDSTTNRSQNWAKMTVKGGLRNSFLGWMGSTPVKMSSNRSKNENVYSSLVQSLLKLPSEPTVKALLLQMPFVKLSCKRVTTSKCVFAFSSVFKPAHAAYS